MSFAAAAGSAWAIALREYRSLFRVPVGWVAIALYLFLTGLIFGVLTVVPGQPASLRYFFGVSGWLLLPVVPAVSMRLFSEEFRSGTMESLLTAPVGEGAIVLGKFTGGFLFLLTMLAPTLVYIAILMAVSDPKPDPGPIAAGYLMLVLLGLLYLAVGTLASAMTANQTLAFLGTLLFLLIVLLVSTVAADRMPAPLDRVLPALSINQRVGDFSRGVIDTAHVVFFLSGAAFFLVLAVVSVQSKRWR